MWLLVMNPKRFEGVEVWGKVSKYKPLGGPSMSLRLFFTRQGEKGVSSSSHPGTDSDRKFP